MTDGNTTTTASASPVTSATVTGAVSKPRLSLSSKQAGIRISLDDFPDDVAAKLPNFLETLVERQHAAEKDCSVGHSMQDKSDIHQLESKPGAQVESINETNKEVSREDLMQLLSFMKSEVIRKDMALAAYKCEQFKRLMNPIEISRSSLAKTFMELQDRLKSDQSKILSVTNKPQGGDSNFEDKLDRNQAIQDDSENLQILNALLEILDRHPLLALPRDTLYCLDYNCNELSTKNYLNLKLRHLDELIDQHRKYRYYMNERLKQSEKKYLNLVAEYERERSDLVDRERSLYASGGRVALLNHIEKLKSDMCKEQERSRDIVISLLNFILDEQEKNQRLNKKLATLEAENETLKSKLTKLTSLSSSEKQEIAKTTNKTSSIKPASTNKPTHGSSPQKSSPSNLSARPAKNNLADSQIATRTPSTNRYANLSSATGSTATPRLTGISSINESGAVPKIQSLFKSSSVSGSVGGSSATTKPKISTGSSSIDQQSNVGSQRRSSTTKPQIPAKPALLLEQQQRNQ